jgi:HEAT repeat protein
MDTERDSMSERERLFTRALRAIESLGELATEEIQALAHLDRDDLARLRFVWDGLDSGHRIGLLNRLHQWEEANHRLEFNAIYRLGLDDLDARVRNTAIRSVVEDRAPELLARLSQLATGDPDADVREAAAAGLAPFALRAELGELHPSDAELVERALFSVLDRAEEPSEVRGAALASLGYLDTVKVAEEIQAAFEDPALRQSALRAMGRSANPTWLDALRLEATSESPATRAEVARASGEMADERAVAFLADMVDDPVIDVRLAAIAALGQIGGEEAREALIYALEDKREVVREAAEAALNELEVEEDPFRV